METNKILYAILAVLVVFAAFQFYQISSLKKSFSNNAITGNAVTGGAINMGGWTETEKMEYEHHGILPTRLQSGNNAPSTGMVGGC